ncbi:ParB/RepB/Spo0J family partition protein [Sphingomicrobium sediminis]|uniref:ParB/RepB/Spo0J family partition protein n=1 Tax=Sphingomicrobium sediminis TaxID=2950949 RepID=A0A9X2ELH7_9SPHN|nr:ParB/RepB/Spo0J family partition protein [Sphingomicrobium sediminis]MCM8557674.1 ParB/RepB/Spo0J family partition protein [Sphingomicrobium sediminis]
MADIERPNRFEIEDERESLLKLEKEGGKPNASSEILASDVLVAPAHFQPRGDSLVMRYGASRSHITEMAKVVSGGGRLDPMTVVSFGPRYVLLDGHHRLAAYREANFSGAIPVEVLDCDKEGLDRIKWAMAESSKRNIKDKLPMSKDDKQDNAWRITVAQGLELSKRELHETCGVSERSIGNMRAVANKLSASGYDEAALLGMSWRGARWELGRLEGNADETSPDARQKRLRRLSKKLAPILTQRLAAKDLLEAMESARPGIVIELEAAIADHKEFERLSKELNI